MDEKTYPVSPLGMLSKVYLLDEKDHAIYKKIHAYGNYILTALMLGLFAVDQYFKTTLLSQYLWLFFIVIAIHISVLFYFASRGTTASKEQTSNFIFSEYNSPSLSGKIRRALMPLWKFSCFLMIAMISFAVVGYIIMGKPVPISILTLYTLPVLSLAAYYYVRKRTKK